VQKEFDRPPHRAAHTANKIHFDKERERVSQALLLMNKHLHNQTITPTSHYLKLFIRHVN
jgi:hypothetical protein